MVKNSPAERDNSLIPGLERSPGEGDGNSFQYSCLENPMDIGAWWVTVHKVTKSRAHVKQLNLHRHTYVYLFLYKFFFHLCSYRISSRGACGFVVDPCWLSILYIVVCIYVLIPNSQFIPPSAPTSHLVIISLSSM